jgi:hypothetical protein
LFFFGQASSQEIVEKLVADFQRQAPMAGAS